MGTPPRKYCPLIISSGQGFTRDFPDQGYEFDLDLDFDDRIVAREDAVSMLSSFGNPSGLTKKKIVVEVTQIVIRFRLYKNAEVNRMYGRSAEDGSARKDLKRNLISFASACIKVRQFIDNTDVVRIIRAYEHQADVQIQQNRLSHSQSDLGQLRPILDRLIEGAKHLEEDDNALRYFSSSPRAGGNRKPERLMIWEPIFSLWMSVGLPLRLSSTGPLMRTLKAVHNACGLEAPSLHAVREAVRAMRAESA